jgi:hypothetical protein
MNEARYIVDYVAVIEWGPEAFNAAVQNLLDKGYDPFGSISIAVTAEGDRTIAQGFVKMSPNDDDEIIP